MPNQRLASISVAHLYRLRNSAGYRKRNASYQPTKPTPIPIGERRKPQPQGSPGYLRIDTVHQGDHEGRKGLYHINAVDQVTPPAGRRPAACPGQACKPKNKTSLRRKKPVPFVSFACLPMVGLGASKYHRKGDSPLDPPSPASRLILR
jgi:hypothetical protein